MGLLACFLAHGQGPPETNAPGRVRYTIRRDTPQGKIPDAQVTGSDARALPNGLVLLKDFELRGFRDGEPSHLQVIALAPECMVDYRDGRQLVENAGLVRIFTPTTNLYVQGTGFYCAESNQVLVISNQVETRVVKSLLRSSLFPAPKTGDDEVVWIFSEHGQFDYRSNLVNYAGNVRVKDPQFEMLSPFLSVQFTTNQTPESILAWENVTITLTNKGIATGATASYHLTNGMELLELTGDARWHNGLQEASAAAFTYDPNRHFLIADDAVRARWPNPATNLTAPPVFRELWADHATLQMSTNGDIVDAMNAEGNVIIVNQADQSRANAAKASYDRTSDSYELTGEADWRNDKMEVQGDRLTTADSNQVFHAQGHAHFKIQTEEQPADRWLDITSDDLRREPVDAQTNLATFRGHVEARLREDGQLQDTLHSQLLLVYLDGSNQVETVVASGDVRAETAPDANGVKKTISCGVLTARRSPRTGLWRSVVAEEDVEIKLTGSGAPAVDDTLTAAMVTAYFSAVTNQVENAVASGDVVFDQDKVGQKIHATGERAVYDLDPVERIVLTGHPVAQKDKILISNADRLIWDVKSGGLSGAGLYHIISNGNPNRKLNPAPNLSVP
jgi:lipopolysaccharide export system protein LptA